MQTTMNIIPLSAVRDAYAQHEVLHEGTAFNLAQDDFDTAVNNGPFTFGDTDLALVTVKHFTEEWPEFEAAVFNVLSSEPDYKCSEPCYIDLMA